MSGACGLGPGLLGLGFGRPCPGCFRSGLILCAPFRRSFSIFREPVRSTILLLNAGFSCRRFSLLR